MLGTDSEHATSALSTAVCQASTEETIFENVLKYASPSVGANGGRESLGGRTDQDDTWTTQLLKIDITSRIQSLHGSFGAPSQVIKRKAIRRRSGRAGRAGCQACGNRSS